MSEPAVVDPETPESADAEAAAEETVVAFVRTAADPVVQDESGREEPGPHRDRGADVQAVPVEEPELLPPDAVANDDDAHREDGYGEPAAAESAPPEAKLSGRFKPAARPVSAPSPADTSPVPPEAPAFVATEEVVEPPPAAPEPAGQPPRAEAGRTGTAMVPVRPTSQVSRTDSGAVDQHGQMEFDGSSRIVFQGAVLTVADGTLKVAQESRNLCALFDTGLWLVSESHKNSPLVTSVGAQARRHGFKVNEPHYVTPDIIKLAYLYAEKSASLDRLDDNQIRRKIVDTLAKAREAGANDIHVEASGGRTKVEFRIDGALRLWETWTQKEGELFLSAVWSHASVQSGVTANWLEPQAAMIAPSSGPDSIAFPEGVQGIRCQWVPLADGGRYLDMRLHYDSVSLLGEEYRDADVDSLGFTAEQTELISHLRRVPGGMRIVSGPVNQGKTTTLRIMLNRRMAETNMSLNLLLIEDPPEGGVHGAREIGISAAHKEEQRERTFNEVMRSALRLDPDIVMLGETRDLTTATFLFRLSLTGRQVYTTLHVYAALAIPQRLRDLGIEPYLVYDYNLVRGMVSQRLSRTLCTHCRIPLVEAARHGDEYAKILRRVRAAIGLMRAERSNLEEPGQINLKVEEPNLDSVYTANADGCPFCFKGRAGRTVIAEVIETDAKLMEYLRENRMDEARTYWLSPQGLGGMSMAWHGTEKVAAGLCSVEDVEIELGPLASERGIRDFESRLKARD